MNPQELAGPWTQGFTLDTHVESSADNERTELGELVYRLKYGSRKDAAALIAAAAAAFVRKHWGETFDVVVPSSAAGARASQSVVLIAGELADVLDLPMITNAFDTAGPEDIAGRRVLLVDDVTESEPALRRSADVLLADAGARSVHALVITRTT